MHRMIITALVALLCTACGSDAQDAQRHAIEQQRAAELEAKKQLKDARAKVEVMAEAATEADRRADAEARQQFAVGPIVKGADKPPQQIIFAALEQMGGRDKIATIETLTGKAKASGAVEQDYGFVMQYPDKMLVDFYGAGGAISHALLVTGDKVYDLTRGRVGEYRTLTLADTLLSMRGDPLCLMTELARGVNGWQLTYLGQTTVIGRQVDALRITPPGSKEITAFFDAETKQLIGTRYEIAPGLTTVIDEQFEKFGGVKVGVVSKQIIGSSITTVKVTDIELNPTLPKGVFDAMKHELIR
jgi:outer membrane lipoprotein-sorting protein